MALNVEEILAENIAHGHPLHPQPPADRGPQQGKLHQRAMRVVMHILSQKFYENSIQSLRYLRGVRTNQGYISG
jgi:hypothetical protein